MTVARQFFRHLGIAPWLVIAFAALPTNAAAQQWSVRGFADVGLVNFAATDSFEAVLGTPSGMVFGGGAELLFQQRVFAALRASRFHGSGERVFVFDDEVFPLGIDTTITVVPVEILGGYRFSNPGARVVPYAGGGIGWHRYDETSDFAEEDENVHSTHLGFQVLGGLEFRIARWIGAATEAQWSTVPESLGQDPNSASAAFGETNLGGATIRVKVVIGR